MKRTTTEPSSPSTHSLKSLAAMLVLVSFGGYAAMSFNPFSRPKRPASLESGHFHDGRTGMDVPTSAVLKRLSGARVVLLGEFHDRPDLVAFQLALVKELSERVGKVSLGLEFFSRDDQLLLDKLAEGSMSEIAFWSHLHRTHGFPYKELLAFARQRGLKLVGLNLPRRVANQVARKGWESLSAAERARWPRPPEASEAYRELVHRAYDEFAEHHRAAFGRFLTAQTLWDSTMADSIERHIESDEPLPLIVVVGTMHVSYGLGIPSRLDSRTSISTVTIVPADALHERLEGISRPIADYVWFSEPATVATASRRTEMTFLRGGVP